MPVVMGQLSKADAVVLKALAVAQDRIIAVSHEYGRTPDVALRGRVQDAIAQLRVVEAVLERGVVREG